MGIAILEHVNLTVSDTNKTTELLGDLFGWKLRWKGAAINSGVTAHVGSDEFYVALYSPPKISASDTETYTTLGGLNHIAVVVDDLDKIEDRIKSVGIETHSHANYEPGRRFYFHDHDGIEYEVVSYKV